MTTVENGISTIGILAECSVLFAFVLRRFRSPRAVALYVGYHLAFTTAVRLLHLRRSELNPVAYYGDAVIDFVLLSGVVAELHLIQSRHFPAHLPVPQAHQPKRGVLRFLDTAGARTVLLALLMLVLGSAVSGLLVMSLHFNGLPRNVVWDDRIDLLTSFLLCTFLIVSAWARGLSSLREIAAPLAINRALTFWASIALIADLSHMNARWAQTTVFDEVSDGAWTVMILYWAWVIWRDHYAGSRS